MWIRTQDKKKLTEVHSVHYVESRSCGYFEMFGDNEYSLGFYNTETECLNILEELQDKIMFETHYSHSGVNSYTCQDYQYGVFEMPPQKESKV